MIRVLLVYYYSGITALGQVSYELLAAEFAHCTILTALGQISYLAAEFAHCTILTVVGAVYWLSRGWKRRPWWS